MWVILFEKKHKIIPPILDFKVRCARIGSGGPWNHVDFNFWKKLDSQQWRSETANFHVCLATGSPTSSTKVDGCCNEHTCSAPRQYGMCACTQPLYWKNRGFREKKFVLAKFICFFFSGRFMVKKMTPDPTCCYRQYKSRCVLWEMWLGSQLLPTLHSCQKNWSQGQTSTSTTGRMMIFVISVGVEVPISMSFQRHLPSPIWLAMVQEGDLSFDDTSLKNCLTIRCCSDN